MEKKPISMEENFFSRWQLPTICHGQKERASKAVQDGVFFVAIAFLEPKLFEFFYNMTCKNRCTLKKAVDFR